MGKRILLADTSSYYRAILKEILVELGHEIVAEATSAAGVIEEYVNARPDVVISDVVFPERSGLLILKKLIGADPEAQIIICSALDNEFFIRQALHEGVKAYLTKPVDVRLLRRELEAL